MCPQPRAVSKPKAVLPLCFQNCWDVLPLVSQNEVHLEYSPIRGLINLYNAKTFVKIKRVMFANFVIA